MPRYKIRFKDSDTYRAALAIESPGTRHPVSNERRNYIAVETNDQKFSAEDAGAMLDKELAIFQSRYGAEVVEDFRFELDDASVFDADAWVEPEEAHPSLDDVIALIGAREAWQISTGENVTIAVVDSGIDGSRPEFPLSKRAGSWEVDGETPWTDEIGHGTMCACIAAAMKSDGGEFDGVAPGARLIACRTDFYDTELAAIYDYLVDFQEQNAGPIIATNSFGIKQGTPPPEPADLDFPEALGTAIAAGIHVFFSAGNNHELAGGDRRECSPTTIWLHKCWSDVMTVATCDLEEEIWFYSSRGPGQFAEGDYAGRPTRYKPDVTAPTPRNGRVVYGDQVRSLPNGWGTSGACPQVAGLAALLLSEQPALGGTELFDVIRNSANRLAGWDVNCQGKGRIDCAAALRMMS